jgi:hypothetical protein
MSRYMNHPLRRMHQLTGPQGTNPTWSVGSQISFKFADVPAVSTALGRKMVNYVAGVRFLFTTTARSTGGVAIPRKVLTPSFISAVQCQGTEVGSPVSFTHMVGGAIDTDTYIRSGLRNPLFNGPGFTLAAATNKTMTYAVDILFAHFGQEKGYQTSPMALFLQPGEIIINAPATLAGVHASLADVSYTTTSVTAHAIILPRPDITIANMWQMTRHKANSASGADNIMINSFGAASTLTGVQTKCGVGSLLWGSSDLVGDAAGPGHVSSITQFAADFLGIRQTNAPRAYVQQLFAELTDGKVIDVEGAATADLGNALYPFFDVAATNAIPANLDLLTSAAYFPIVPPAAGFQASKLLDAVGNPSYDLTGTFTAGANHYTYLEGCYPFTMDKLNDLLAVIQRAHVGLEIYGSDDLILSTKLADAQSLEAVAMSNPAALTYLPRSVIPRSKAA